eukprot:GHVU01182038.1.p1 GENE.GHVU01182038.1~~GHVU01182038.1.p1  ORF type:complete len:437 (+),score=12.78 GHVU01182038.1:61-1371(+)
MADEVSTHRDANLPKSRHQKGLSLGLLRKICAVILIFAIIVVWLTMAELIKGLEKRFARPYFLTFIVHGFYALCFVPWLIYRLSPFAAPSDGNYIGYYNWCYYFGASVPLAVASFVSGWLWYLSLPGTSMSANTAIYQSMSAFVYLFSIRFLKETITYTKTASVCVSILGVFLVSFGGSRDNQPASSHVGHPHAHPGVRAGDGESAEMGMEWSIFTSPIFGYLFCTLSMILYALFEVFYKKWASHSADPTPTMNAIRFLGLIGVSTVLFLGPPLLLLDLSEMESFLLPKGEDAQLLVIIGVLDCLFNLFLFLVITLSSPLFASVGCLLVLPASVVWDWIGHDYVLPFWARVGVGLIVIGFVGFLIGELMGGGKIDGTMYEYEVVVPSSTAVAASKGVTAAHQIPFEGKKTASENAPVSSISSHEFIELADAAVLPS